ncbi:MAG: hypothetical protein HC933_10405 [Pleurocapsa sp. SU_196_0]|nr:hypothetical protein [Pleurocapsa sp. SU_196_0]
MPSKPKQRQALTVTPPAKTISAKRAPTPRAKGKVAQPIAVKSNTRKTPAAKPVPRKPVRGQQAANTPAARGTKTRKSRAVPKSTGKTNAKPMTRAAKTPSGRATKPATKPARVATPTKTQVAPRTKRQRPAKTQPTPSARHQTGIVKPRVTPTKTRATTPQPRAKPAASTSKPRAALPVKRAPARK